MLAIKYQKIGKKHQPSFRIIVGEKRTKLNGRQHEDIGWYNPQNKQFIVSKERALHWIKNGAQPTDTVHNLLVRAGVFDAPKRAVHSKAKIAEVKSTEQKPA